jgi:hypothetical protein
LQTNCALRHQPRNYGSSAGDWNERNQRIIAVSSAHRAAALDACRYAIDTLKDRAIWKKSSLRMAQYGPTANCPRPAETPAANLHQLNRWKLFDPALISWTPGFLPAQFWFA